MERCDSSRQCELGHFAPALARQRYGRQPSRTCSRQATVISATSSSSPSPGLLAAATALLATSSASAGMSAPLWTKA